MKTDIYKNIRHSLLIEENELKALYSFISSKYTQVKVIAICVDGSRLETNEINDITSFENPNFRRIKIISIQARNNYEDRKLEKWCHILNSE